MSNLSVAYSGPVGMPPVFNSGPGFQFVYANPLRSVPSSDIRLHASEVASACSQLGYQPWGQLNPAQKKRIASAILYARGDPTSIAQAGQVLMNNPAYQGFQIILGAAAL
jgi:hypothetical protein